MHPRSDARTRARQYWIGTGRFIAACVSLALMPGCVTARAKTASSPPLDVPAPPQHMVEPIVAEAPEPLPLPEDPRPAPVRPLRPATPTTTAVRPEPPKPEVPTTVEKPPEEAPKPATTTTLQTTTAAEEGEVERSVHATLTRASTDLNRVNYRALNTEARVQYDTARRFIQQAEDAIRQKNLVLAKNLADKAAVIAAQQAGR